jgi:hypothetical protein
MPPKASKRARDISEDYDSDNGFVVDSDASATGGAPKSKKQRPSTKPSTSTTTASSPPSDPTFELSTGRNSRRVTITSFKSARLINIREYYTNPAGEYLPGKKGISLSVEQYKKLLEAIPGINRALRVMGEDAVMPKDEEGREEQGGNEVGEGEGEVGEDEEGGKTRRKKSGKVEKANFEETSEEEE